MSERMSGGCACGKVRFTAVVHDDKAYLCHCRMCQRASGNVSLAMKNVEQAEVDWQGEPAWYESSPIARRAFCACCGTSIGFCYNEGTSKMDLTVAAFDDSDRFVPASHFGAESMHEAWLDTTGLKRMASSDYQPLVERWHRAGREVPE